MRDKAKKNLKLVSAGFLNSKLPNADLLDSIARISRGLEQAKNDQGQSVDEVFDELERSESTFKS
jgi:hypothetical protein